MDDDRLFCSACNVVVDHLRKFVVDKHLEVASHKRNGIHYLVSLICNSYCNVYCGDVIE